MEKDKRRAIAKLAPDVLAEYTKIHKGKKKPYCIVIKNTRSCSEPSRTGDEQRNEFK